MRENAIKLVLLLQLLFFAQFFLPSDAFSQVKKTTYNVGFNLEQSTQELDSLLVLLQDEIKAVVGEDAIINYSKDLVNYNQYDLQKAKTNYQALVDNGADLIVSIGYSASLVLSQIDEIPVPTIRYAAIPISFEKAKSGLKEKDNLVSLLQEIRFKEDIKTFQQLANFKTVAIALESALESSNVFTNEIKNYLDGEQTSYRLLYYNSVEDLISQLQPKEGLYVLTGFELSSAEVKKLAEACIKDSIPTFSGVSTKHVELGLLATSFEASNLEISIRKIALEVESIVNKVDSSSTLKVEANRLLTINYNTAQKIDLPLRYSLIASAKLVGSIEESAADTSYDLYTAMQVGLEQNLNLQLTIRDAELAKQEARAAKADYLPNVIANANGNYTDPELAEVSNGQNPEVLLNGTLQASQTIFSPTANTNIGSQKDLLQAALEDLNAEKLNTVFDVANAYFNMLLLKTNLAITSLNLEETEVNLKIAVEKYEAGSSSKVDVLRLESQRAQITQTFIEAINSLQQAEYFFNQTLNQPITTRVDIEDVNFDSETFDRYNYKQIRDLLDNPATNKAFADFLVEKAIENAPELKSLNYNENAIKRAYNLSTYGRFMPTVALQGQYYQEFARDGVGTDFPAFFPSLPTEYYNVGVNVSLPIFQQNRQNINRQAALIQQDQIEISKANFKLNLEQSVRSSILQLINQIANIELSEVSKIAAKENLDLSQDAYQKGAINIIQLIDAQNNYFQQVQANANAVYNFLLSAIELERRIANYFILNSEEENAAFEQEFFQYIQDQQNK